MHLGYREVPEREAGHKGRIGHPARNVGTTVCRYGETKGRRFQILVARYYFFAIAQVDLQVLSSNKSPTTPPITRNDFP